MTDNVGQVDAVLFKRWTDAVALRDAMAELEGRMSERLEKAAESLQPWLEEQGYSFVEVEAKYARVNVARANWMNKKKQQPCVWIALDALFPYGFRKVQEEHPLVWVRTYNLEKDDRRVFQEHLTNRLRGKGGDWINEDCTARALRSLFAVVGSAAMLGACGGGSETSAPPTGGTPAPSPAPVPPSPAARR